GWNFAVAFKGHKIPAEIQVNTYDLMYGKMSKDEYASTLLAKDKAKYEQREQEMVFPGGLQHLLYEIARDKKEATPEERKAAAELGIWYTNLCRMGPADRTAKAKDCCNRYQKFCDSLTSAFAKKVVKDHPLDAKWGVVV